MTVAAVEVSARERYADGRRFGTRAYEQLRGRLHYAVDPGSWPEIVDLDLAPRNGAGQVCFSGDFVMVRPLGGPAPAVVLDVPNRGRPLAFGHFNRVPRAQQLQAPTAAGDGFLHEHGLAVLSVGWQCDVLAGTGMGLTAPRAAGVVGPVIARMQPPADMASLFHGQPGTHMYAPLDLDDPEARLYVSTHPDAELQPIPRDHWRFARQRRGSSDVQPDARFIWLQDGFRAGRHYTLVYRSRDPFVVGCGLLAVRSAALALRGTGELGGHDQVLAFGVSQTGRFLRHFLALGLNAPRASEAQGRVLDGALIHIAGAQRGDFNHRFAQPGQLGVPSCGQQPPFDLPLTAAPKTVVTNTSWEYWRGDAALAHLTPASVDGKWQPVDRPLAPHERIWLLAGTHHIGAVLPPTRELADLGLKTAAPLNMIDAGPLLRAALVNLLHWITDGRPPPPSRVPRVDDGSAVTRAEVLARFADGPRLDADALPTITELDLGSACPTSVSRWASTAAGIRAPPSVAPPISRPCSRAFPGCLRQLRCVPGMLTAVHTRRGCAAPPGVWWTTAICLPMISTWSCRTAWRASISRLRTRQSAASPIPTTNPIQTNRHKGRCA